MPLWNYKLIANKENINLAMDFVCSKLNKVNTRCRDAVIAASCEILSNIVNYAYSNEGGEIEIELSMDNKIISVTFMDKGQPFDPNTVKDNEVVKGKSMGIFIARNMMDTYEYKYVDNKNISIIEKKI